MNYFDCHADTLTTILPSESLWNNSGCLDLFRIQKFAHYYTQIFAIWLDRMQIQAAGENMERAFWQLYQRGVFLLQEQPEAVVWCKNAADMCNAHASGRAAVFLSIEDLSIMGSYAERIHELGFRFAMLSWNYENEYACGAVTDQSKGLTQKGRMLVDHLLEQRIVLDISHLSDRGAEDLFEITERPVMASHSNVRDVCGHPRNLRKEHVKELVRRKGLIGLNFYDQFVGNKPKLADLIRHADAVLNLGGEDLLALGSDFDGCGDNFPEGVSGVQSIPALKEVFERHFGSRITEKIFFENAYRFVLNNAG